VTQPNQPQPQPTPPVVTDPVLVTQQLLQEFAPTVQQYQSQLGALWFVDTMPNLLSRMAVAGFDGGLLWLVRNVQDSAGQQIAAAVWTTAEAPEAVKFLSSPT
jgi:hypothetical protein